MERQTANSMCQSNAENLYKNIYNTETKQINRKIRNWDHLRLQSGSVLEFSRC